MTHKPDKEIITTAMLNTCSQGVLVTQSLMEQLNTEGIPTSVKIKTLIGHQTESSEIVKGLSVSKAASQNEQQKWTRLPTAFSKKEIPAEPCKNATNWKLQRWKYLERTFGEIGNNGNIKVDLLIGANWKHLSHLKLYQAKIKVHMCLEQLWDGVLLDQ